MHSSEAVFTYSFIIFLNILFLVLSYFLLGGLGNLGLVNIGKGFNKRFNMFIYYDYLFSFFIYIIVKIRMCFLCSGSSSEVSSLNLQTH